MIQNCKSFTLDINQNINISVTTWNTTGVQFPWTVFDGTTLRKSDFFLEGFKNIEIYGFSLVGMVYPNRNPSVNQVLIDDWGVVLTIDGTTNLVNGFFSTNSFLATQGSKRIALSKNLNQYELADPIVSVKRITIAGLTANGIQNESVTTIDLLFDISIIVYYKFEGE